MARFVPPITQLVNDDASGVASGWKLNFFASGTSTRKDTFSDDALTVANANPVVADSAGRFGPIFLEAGSYRVTLTDVDDVQKWDADPVDGGVGASGAVDEIDANYTVTISDATKVLNVDASGGAKTITLLAAATAGDGFEVTVKKSDATTNTVTIDGNGAETIDGETTITLTAQHHAVTIRCDAAGWQAVSFYAQNAALQDIVDGNTRGAEIVRKSGTTTVNNSTTLVDAGSLLVSLAANERVLFEAIIRYDGNATADIKFAFTVPAGATLAWTAPGRVTDETGSGRSTSEATSSGETIAFGGGSGLNIFLTGTVINDATPGDLQLQFAQNSADMSDTSVLGDSRIIAWRV